MPPSIAVKVLLLNTMREQRVSPAELARRPLTSPQSGSRLVNLGHATRSTRLRWRCRSVNRCARRQGRFATLSGHATGVCATIWLVSSRLVGSGQFNLPHLDEEQWCWGV